MGDVRFAKRKVPRSAVKDLRGGLLLGVKCVGWVILARKGFGRDAFEGNRD